MAAKKGGDTEAVPSWRLLPADYMQPLPEGGLRRSDLLISHLLEARAHARGSDLTERKNSQDLIARLWEALGEHDDWDAIEMLIDVIGLAEAESGWIRGHRLQIQLTQLRLGGSEESNRAARLMLAENDIGEMFPRLKKVPTEVIRNAMWPPRGETGRARAALARALGWNGRSNESIHVVIARRRNQRLRNR